MVDIASHLCFFIRSRIRLNKWGQTGLFPDTNPFGMICLELFGVEVEGTYDLLRYI